MNQGESAWEMTVLSTANRALSGMCTPLTRKGEIAVLLNCY